MKTKPTRQESVELGAVPAPVGGPMQPSPYIGPGFVPGPLAGPSAVAPVRRVVHPTRVVERHSVIRYPIENIYPTHVKNVRHHVCEYFCEYPVSESVEECYHTVDHCCPPPAFRR